MMVLYFMPGVELQAFKQGEKPRKTRGHEVASQICQHGADKTRVNLQSCHFFESGEQTCHLNPNRVRGYREGLDAHRSAICHAWPRALQLCSHAQHDCYDDGHWVTGEVVQLAFCKVNLKTASSCWISKREAENSIQNDEPVGIPWKKTWSSGRATLPLHWDRRGLGGQLQPAGRCSSKILFWYFWYWALRCFLKTAFSYNFQIGSSGGILV